jgi:hypothetical protein
LVPYFDRVTTFRITAGFHDGSLFAIKYTSGHNERTKLSNWPSHITSLISTVYFVYHHVSRSDILSSACGAFKYFVDASIVSVYGINYNQDGIYLLLGTD